MKERRLLTVALMYCSLLTADLLLFFDARGKTKISSTSSRFISTNSMAVILYKLYTHSQ